MAKEKEIQEAAEESKEESKAALIAKKAFVIVQNEFMRVIALGDDISDVPKKYHPNLKTEGII